MIPSFLYCFIPASNEPSDCLQAFGDCREGQIPRPLGCFKSDAPLLAAGSLTDIIFARITGQKSVCHDKIEMARLIFEMMQ